MVRAARTIRRPRDDRDLGLVRDGGRPPASPGELELRHHGLDDRVAADRAPLAAGRLLAGRRAVGFEHHRLRRHVFLPVFGTLYLSAELAHALQLPAACRTSGLTLAPGGNPRTATLRIKLSRLELRAAARPDLASSADPDGDGVPNAIRQLPDCRQRFSGQRERRSGDRSRWETSAPVSIGPASGRSRIRILTASPMPATTACGIRILWRRAKRRRRMSIATESVTLASGSHRSFYRMGGSRSSAITSHSRRLPSKVAFFRIDFGRAGVLTCDAGFTGCTIDPSAVRVSLAGSSTTYPCH